MQDLGADRKGSGTRGRSRAGRGRAAAAGFGHALCGLSRRAPHPAAALPRGLRWPAATPIRQPPSAAAAAIELLHCASLVHDDLPCFDDADTRRGKPSVHAQFGEPIAVLAGDALIVLAFETLAREVVGRARRLARLVSIVAAAVGAPRGIVAGQAWECEAAVPLVDYQRAKTGALFVGSTHGRRGGGRRRSRTVARRSAKRSAKPIRSRTICAMCSAMRRNSASRSARTPRAIARTPPPSSESAAPRRGSRTWSRPRSDSIPACPGRARASRADQGADRAVLPQAARSRRGLNGRAPMAALSIRMRLGRDRSASGSGPGAAGSSPTPGSSAGPRLRR